jgi:hypothetical protein
MKYPSSLAHCYRRIRYRGTFQKRFDVINYFARRRRLNRYLEIGTRSGDCLSRVICSKKMGVDPEPRGFPFDCKIQSMTSDAFFAGNTTRFDLIFIDGLHLAEQVVRDIYHSLPVLDAPGVILLHDCNPQSEVAQRRAPVPGAQGVWNGDVWKAIAFVRRREANLWVRVVDVDYGIGVVIPRRYGVAWELSPAVEADAASFIATTAYGELEEDRVGVLGLVADRADLERDLRRDRIYGG